jgi:hypothetical protein
MEPMRSDSACQAVDDSAPRGKASLRVVEGQTYQDWEDVYRDNIVGIYHLVFRRVGNAPDAEDLSAEILLQALRRLRLPAPRWPPPGRLGARAVGPRHRERGQRGGAGADLEEHGEPESGPTGRRRGSSPQLVKGNPA